MSRGALRWLALCTGALPVLFSQGLAHATWSTSGAGLKAVGTATLEAPGTPTVVRSAATVELTWAAAAATAGTGLRHQAERQVTGSGLWSVVCPAAVQQSCTDTIGADGTYDYRVRALVGSWETVSGTSAPVAVTVFVPTPSTPDLIATDDTGVSAVDDVTARRLPTFTGTALAGSTVWLTVDGTVVAGQVLAPGATDYALTVPSDRPLADGLHAVRVLAVRDTTSSSPTPALSVLVDTAAPALATLSRAGGPATASPSVSWNATFSEPVVGVDPSDFTLVSTGLLGTTAPTSTVSSPPTSWVVSGGTGTGEGTLRLDAVSDGTIADLAGNALLSGLTGETYTVDRTGPLVTSISSGPGANGTVEVGDTFAVSFSEPLAAVAAGTQTLTFTRGGGRSGTIASLSGLTATTFDPGADYTSAKSTATFTGTLALSADRSTVTFTITADGNCTTTNKKTTCTLITGAPGYVSGFLPSPGLTDDAGNSAQQVAFSQAASATLLF